MSSPSTDLLERAFLIKREGANRLNVAELAAVHAGLYPAAEPVRTGCRQCLIDAYQAVLRYLRTEAPTESSSFSSTTMSNTTSKARFDSDDRQYFPHNSPVAYSNENLTDSAARHILKNDPDAKAFFKVLPDAEPKAAANKPAAAATAKPAAVAAATKTETAVVLSDSLSRDELNAIYADEVKEGNAADFANKADLIAAIEQHRSTNAPKA